MLVIGIILVVVGLGGGALLGYLAAQSTQVVTVSAAGVSVGLLPLTLVVAGAAVVLLVWLGARLGAVGARRKRRQRRELKEKRREVKELRASTGSGGPSAPDPHPGSTTSAPPSPTAGSTPPAPRP